jgi:hypothetical protein
MVASSIGGMGCSLFPKSLSRGNPLPSTKYLMIERTPDDRESLLQCRLMVRAHRPQFARGLLPSLLARGQTLGAACAERGDGHSLQLDAFAVQERRFHASIFDYSSPRISARTTSGWSCKSCDARRRGQSIPTDLDCSAKVDKRHGSLHKTLLPCSPPNLTPKAHPERTTWPTAAFIVEGAGKQAALRRTRRFGRSFQGPDSSSSDGLLPYIW